MSLPRQAGTYPSAPYPGRSQLRRSSLSAVLAAERLSALEVLSFLGTSIAPLAVIGGAISTGWAVTGVRGFPLAFLLVGAALAVFCVGYVAVARHLRNAGAFSAYVAAGLGRPLGVAAAFIALASYGAFSIAILGMIGPTLSALIADKTGLQLSWWIPALLVLALVAVLGVARVDINSRLLGWALAAELILVVALDVIDVAHPHGGHIRLDTWSPASLGGGGLGVALVIAMNGFVGFEAAAAFSEEAKEPARTVRRATFLALAVMTGVYAVSAWAMSITIGPANLAAAATQQGPDLPFTAAAALPGGSLLIDLGHVLFLTSLFASSLAFHNTTSRYAFALGRERVLPSFLGATAPRTNAPRAASLLLSGVALAVITGYVITDADPVVQLFFAGTTTASFGVLILITATSFAVIGYFNHDPQKSPGVWQARVAPALAGLALTAAIWQILDAFPTLLGAAPGSQLAWILPSAFPVLAGLGIGWALTLRATRPDIYQRIGLGGPTLDGPPPAANEPPPGPEAHAPRQGG